MFTLYSSQSPRLFKFVHLGCCLDSHHPSHSDSLAGADLAHDLMSSFDADVSGSLILRVKFPRVSAL